MNSIAIGKIINYLMITMLRAWQFGCIRLLLRMLAKDGQDQILVGAPLS